MNYKSIDIKSCYETGIDDVIEDFYDPVLSLSVSYDRIAGFFTSSTLATSARGMAAFINNGGVMRLICSPVLSKEDAEELERSADPTSIIDISLENIEDEFISNHVKAMGWLLQNNRLDIRLAVLTDSNGGIQTSDDVLRNGLFHQKVGILTDMEGNEISFSGSINETASAWTRNDEEFKVFRSWEETDYFQKDRRRFQEMWNGARKNLKIYSVPEAVKDKIISYSKDFNTESISVKKYREQKSKSFFFKKSRISLFTYQREALDMWKSNDCRLLFEMATGSGKTRTAVAGMDWLFSVKNKLVAIVACPQGTLARQWMSNEVQPLGVHVDEEIVADSTNPSWERHFRSMIFDCALGIKRHCIVYTTHATFSSERFRNVVTEDGEGCEFLLIADEAHWLGAPKLQQGLLEQYKYRIGLSATPSRWFDDDGTILLQKYFGGKSFEFSIKNALTEINPLTGKHFLVNYYYYISKVSLSDEESSRYKRLCNRLVKLSYIKNKDEATKASYNRLLEQRADVIRNANNKYDILRKTIKKLQLSAQLEGVIIFVSPQQIDEVCLILKEMGVVSHRLTEKQGTKPDSSYGGISEREHIIKCFRSGIYQVLVAIKCLDEGIDIPDARIGILMASSTNPREYVQRIGRVIRQSPDKKYAELYDICVDTISDLDEFQRELERKLRQKEQTRLYEIANNAINNTEALKAILSLNH